MSQSTKPNITSEPREDKAEPEIGSISEIADQQVTFATPIAEPVEMIVSPEVIAKAVPIEEKPRMMTVSAPVPLVGRPAIIATPQQRGGTVFELSPVGPSWDLVSFQYTAQFPPSSQHVELHTSKSLSAVPIRRITEFNGHISDDVAIKLAMSLSATPQTLHGDFIRELFTHQFKEAFAIFDMTSEEAKALIQGTLDAIPWRISCEYHLVNGKVKWYNTWIKIGWWSSVVREISPQLQKVRWTHEDLGAPYGIDGNSFLCTVRRGFGGETLRRLLTGNNPVNVKLEFRDGILTPIDFACIGTGAPEHMFDLANIEFGALAAIPNGNQEMDAARLHARTQDLENGMQLLFFQGSTSGKSIRNEAMEDLDLFEVDADYPSDLDNLDYEEFDEPDEMEFEELPAVPAVTE